MGSMEKKKPSNKSSDTHKQQGFVLRLHESMLLALDKFVERNGSDRSTECRIALREYLERYGYWPPKPDGK